MKRDDASACSYAQSTSRRRHQNNQSAMSTPDDMQNRIDRLESLVLSLMTNGAQSVGPTAAVATVSGDGSIDSRGPQSAGANTIDIDLKDEESDTEQVTKSFGIMKVDNQSQKSYYVSEAHWSTILNDVWTFFHLIYHGFELMAVLRFQKLSSSGLLIRSSMRSRC